MSKTTFNGFPIDGSYGSQIQYDLFVNYMSGAISSASAAKSGDAGFIGFFVGILQIIFIIIVTILLLLGKLLFWVNRQLTNERLNSKQKEGIPEETINENLYSDLEPDREIEDEIIEPWVPLTNKELGEAINLIKK